MLSNQPVAQIEPLAGGRQDACTSQRTPPLSTYLFALAVGELEALRAGLVRRDARSASGTCRARERLTGVRARGRARVARAARAVLRPALPVREARPRRGAGLRGRRDGERRRGVLPRDAAARRPDDRRRSPEKKRVAEVICHELAHMWYGNLVTMAWWDDLWLNEAFATWMAFQIVDEWKPEWRMWNDFQHHRAAALGARRARATRTRSTPR